MTALAIGELAVAVVLLLALVAVFAGDIRDGLRAAWKWARGW